jgi:hypothetical protein
VYAKLLVGFVVNHPRWERCVNHARRDLCGGHPAMDVPTAIGVPEDHSFLRNAPELDYSSFCVTIGTGTPAALLRRI